MSTGTALVLVVVLFMVFGGLPQVSGPYHGMGYGLSGGLGLLLIILLVLFLFGRI